MIRKYYFYMKYLLLTLFFISFSAFSLEQNDIENKLPLACSNSNVSKEVVAKKNIDLSQSRITNNYFNCLNDSKNVTKAPKISSPSQKVTMGAAVLLNPLAAAYWFVDKMVRDGVDKTINK